MQRSDLVLVSDLALSVQQPSIAKHSGRHYPRGYMVSNVDKANLVLSWVSQQPGARVASQLAARHDKYGGLGLFLLQDPADACSLSGVRVEQGARLATVVTKGTELFRIPRACMLQLPAVGPGTPSPAAGRQHAALALELLRQRTAGDASPWATYLSCLPGPSELPHLLLRHMEELVQVSATQEGAAASHLHTVQQQEQAADPQEGAAATLVQRVLSASPSTLEAFTKLCDQVREEYREIVQQAVQVTGADVVPRNEALPAVSLLDYVWARCIVASRAIHLWSGTSYLPFSVGR